MSTATSAAANTAAVTAAFFRPHQFGIVIVASPSTINSASGRLLPLVMRCRDQPPGFRAYVMGNEYDNDTPWGSWALAAREVHGALKFRGEDTVLKMGEGGHSVRLFASELSNALCWAFGKRNSRL